MKHLFFALLLLAGVALKAQNAGDSYAFSSEYTGLKKFDSFSSTLIDEPNTIYKALRGQIFTIKSRVSTPALKGYSIMFWTFKKGKQVQPKENAIREGAPPVHVVIGDAQNGDYFFISDADMSAVTTSTFNKPRGIASLDAVVVPIKLRFHNQQPGGEFDFSQSISVGPAISLGRNFGGAFGNNSVAVLFGLNGTNVSVDSSSAPGAVSSKTTLVGLTPFLGINYTHNNINFALFCGIDILTGKAERVWAYRNSPWLGVSVGLSILTTPAKQNGGSGN